LAPAAAPPLILGVIREQVNDLETKARHLLIPSNYNGEVGSSQITPRIVFSMNEIGQGKKPQFKATREILQRILQMSMTKR